MSVHVISEVPQGGSDADTGRPETETISDSTDKGDVDGFVPAPDLPLVSTTYFFVDYVFLL